MLKLIDLAVDIFVIWLLYRIVADFVIPLLQLGRKVQKHIKSMQDPHPGSYASFQASRQKSHQQEGEYIDFEEIKDTHAEKS
ncbi:MAG: hypothetical protein IMW88_04085 [Thermoflavifilum sp.]|uniref:hypothetical protein n=1 Tax=Thermoflavifilum sp. TaxID=1968839 RepID=UPI0018A38C4B|nr:hypothetical protein [Thermoflavifilum sp.]QOR76725.1 MAG: hypothetical protein IMW88_04085 [Thermoflavifilum sp.]